MLLNNEYTLIPKIKFTLTFDNGIVKVIYVKVNDVITCTYRRDSKKLMITGKVVKIASQYNSSLGAVAQSTYLQIDGSEQYAGQVVYVQPSEVIDIVLVTVTDEIQDVVCSVDNTDQKICLVRRNPDTEAFEYSMDGTTWVAVEGSEAGTKNYNELNNKPSIAGKTLVGDKPLYELGIAAATDLATLSATVADVVEDVDDIVTNQLPKKQTKLAAGPGISITPATESTPYDVISADGASPHFADIQGEVSENAKLVTEFGKKQDTITSEAMLSSDLVDDTDKTHLFVSAEEKDAWNAKQGGLTAGDGIDATELTTNKKIQVINPMSDEQKAYLEDQLFEKNFVVEITASTADKLNVFTAPDSVVFTLTSKYAGTLVDLVAVPDGWVKTTGVLGTYTRQINIVVTGTSEVILTSGAPVCSYSATRYKTATEKTVRVYKPAYIVTSNNLSILPGNIQALVDQSNTVKVGDARDFYGEQTINSVGTANGKYVYYIVPKYYNIVVAQFGVDIVNTAQEFNNITIDNKAIGDYQYYRTEEPVGTTSLTAIVMGG